MTVPFLLPDELQLNAWTGVEAAHGALDPQAGKWGARRGLPHGQEPLFEAPADPKQWFHSDVGYGVLLPDNDDPALSAAAKAAGEDAPEPIRELLAARPGTVVLRWRADLGDRFLRRYFPDGTSQDPQVGLSRFGIAKGRLPRYVVIVGGPDVIPWSTQYALGTRHAVGRLPFTGAELGNYVSALLSGWKGFDVDVRAPLMWTVDHGGGDITSQMRAVIAKPLAAALEDPRLPGFQHLTDGSASASDLLAALSKTQPGLVVTSSHGRTAPLDDPAQMRATLGLPVDVGHGFVDINDLVDAMPAGAVWYAQACCSAGGNAPSNYTGLLQPQTSAFGVVQAVADLGPTVAPAALRLLGRPAPARAVIGHVEPTFDWTLRVAETGQGLGHDIVAALSSNIYDGQPLGLAFADYRAGVGVLHRDWADFQDKLNRGDTSVRPTLTRLRLTALDRQSLVLLGDPTVTLPPLS